MTEKEPSPKSSASSFLLDYDATGDLGDGTRNFNGEKFVANNTYV